MDAFHVMIETATGIGRGHERNDDVVFVVRANKFPAMLIGNGEQVGAQHLHGTHLQLWVIQYGVKFNGAFGYQILQKNVYWRPFQQPPLFLPLPNCNEVPNGPTCCSSEFCSCSTSHHSSQSWFRPA
jgi:hypothetical protein